MRTAGVILAIALALALQTTLARAFARDTVGVDLVLVVVVYAALAGGPLTGLLAGTVAGLVQDSLASPVIGIGGLAKSLVGFLAGLVGTQFIVAQPLPRFIVFFGATLVDVLVFHGLYALLDLRAFGMTHAALAAQALANAVAGVIAFQVAGFLPGAIERRRLSRSRFRR